MPTWISETPLWLPVALVALGVFLFWTGNNRLEKRIRWAGISVIALAVLLGAISYYLESDREQVVRKTRQIVNACEDRDVKTIEGLLHPRVAILNTQGPGPVAQMAKVAADRVNLNDVRIVSQDTQRTPGGSYAAVIQVVANSTITNWELRWDKTDQGFLLREVTPLGGPGLGATFIESFIRPRGASSAD